MAAGATSCAHWLADLIDIEISTAREHVRVAKALRHLPRVRRLHDRGSISYAKVRHLTRVATCDNETELLELAARHPSGDLGRALSAWQHHHDPDALAQRQIAGRAVWSRTDPDGSRVITIVLPRDRAAGFEALLDREVRGLRREDGPAGPSPARATLAQQRADGFCRLVARMARGAGDASADAPSAFPPVELILHRRVGRTELADGMPIHPCVAQQLTCDAVLRVMTHFPDGSPADVGLGTVS